MAFSSAVFGRKVHDLRTHLGQELDEVANVVGLPSSRLEQLEQGTLEPTGDEVLILADYFRRDFRFLIEDEKSDPAKQVDLLFRNHGDELRPSDRMAIAEFAYLCGCQAFLEREMGWRPEHPNFRFHPTGTFYKGHGERCARALRQHLGYSHNEIVRDIYDAMRRMGFKVFRRRLENSSISGIYMNHPEAGPCVLVNYAEGQARQRFSAGHEWGHGLLDDKPTTLSKVSEWNSADWSELRANTFASCFLVPPELLRAGRRERWKDPNEIASSAALLRVSAPALLSALVNANVLTKEQRDQIRPLVPRVPDPVDPEFEGLNDVQTARRSELLARGLSKNYVNLALDAYADEKVSRGLLGDMLLASSSEVAEIAALFGRTLKHE
jgi:Zn-dependent peptidase ImmA (M78 family)/transcriptional regulator with XRE-family HTH domain